MATRRAARAGVRPWTGGRPIILASDELFTSRSLTGYLALKLVALAEAIERSPHDLPDLDELARAHAIRRVAFNLAGTRITRSPAATSEWARKDQPLVDLAYRIHFDGDAGLLGCLPQPHDAVAGVAGEVVGTDLFLRYRTRELQTITTPAGARYVLLAPGDEVRDAGRLTQVDPGPLRFRGFHHDMEVIRRRLASMEPHLEAFDASLPGVIRIRLGRT